MDTMANETVTAPRRRRYSEQLKRQVLAQCDAPGASVAKVAMAHGINANIVHSWRKRARAGVALPLQAEAPDGFVPVIVPTHAPAAPARHVQVHLRRGATAIEVSWPLEAAAEMGVWLRELLR